MEIDEVELKTADLADALKVHRRTIGNWIRDPQRPLPAAAPPRAGADRVGYRFKIGDVKAWLREQGDPGGRNAQRLDDWVRAHPQIAER